MNASWQDETGSLLCRWSETTKLSEHTPGWVHDTSRLLGSHLPSLPDFASHSPFGGPSWFQPGLTSCDSE
jgi:hypothetical protein